MGYDRGKPASPGDDRRKPEPPGRSRDEGVCPIDEPLAMPAGDACRLTYSLSVRGRTWRLGGVRPPGRTYLMGVLNVTPDSFSDGGRFLDVEAAVARGLEMLRDGADVLDVGGESTRPGHEPVPAREEIARVRPVIEALRARTDAPISIDTRKAVVAAAALEAGADWINDVSGLSDPEMAAVAAGAGVPVVIMHGLPAEPGPGLLPALVRDLERMAAAAERAGVRSDRIVADPGLGFGKGAEANLQILREFAGLAELRLPLLVGASRKGFIGRALGLPVGEREEGSNAAAVAAVLGGAHIVRVHDVRSAWRSARMADAILGRVELPPAPPGSPPPPVTGRR